MEVLFVYGIVTIKMVQVEEFMDKFIPRISTNKEKNFESTRIQIVTNIGHKYQLL